MAQAKGVAPIIFYPKIYSLIAKLYLDLWIKICYHSIAAKSRADVLLVVLPQIGVRQHSRNILTVFYPTGAAHGLTPDAPSPGMAQAGSLGHAQRN